MSEAICTDLLEFIDKSPTPFHATNNLSRFFEKAGFLRAQAGEPLEANASYVFVRNDSSIIALRTGKNLDNGIRMLGAHTDSPSLRIKPNAEKIAHGCLQLGIEVYGGALLHPWIDRDLSIAGRVSGLTADGQLTDELIDVEKPIGIIPNLAIHLDREANKSKTVNPQNHLPMIIGLVDEASTEAFNFKQYLLQFCKSKIEQILDYELSCYDAQPPAIVGLSDEFISSARLDNLLSSYIAARALIDTNCEQASLFVSTDHEEVGSASACGAQGPFLQSILRQWMPSAKEYSQTINRSIMVSCDNAHAIHPNYADKHDHNHGPIINRGPVIKINSNQRYATNSRSSAWFQRICEQASVPTQHFVVRSDLACGSTIGPITASEIGINTIDIGAAQWAMHSIRETAGVKDCAYLYQALRAVYEDTKACD